MFTEGSGVAGRRDDDHAVEFHGVLRGQCDWVAKCLGVIGAGRPLRVERELGDGAEADADNVHAIGHGIVDGRDDRVAIAEFIDVGRAEDFVVPEESLGSDAG